MTHSKHKQLQYTDQQPQHDKQYTTTTNNTNRYHGQLNNVKLTIYILLFYKPCQKQSLDF